MIKNDIYKSCTTIKNNYRKFIRIVQEKCLLQQYYNNENKEMDE